jgi:hypothetical protein
MTTAATDRYLIEAVDGRVDLCESQGGSWVTIRCGISREMARRHGFSLDSPAVQAVFTEAVSASLRRRPLWRQPLGRRPATDGGAW